MSFENVLKISHVMNRGPNLKITKNVSMNRDFYKYEKVSLLPRAYSAASLALNLNLVSMMFLSMGTFNLPNIFKRFIETSVNVPTGIASDISVI